MRVLCHLSVSILKFPISLGIMILNGLPMGFLKKLQIILKLGSKNSRLKDSKLKSSKTKVLLLLSSPKLLEISLIKLSSFMGILISNHLSQDGTKTRGQQLQLFKMGNFMVGVELMMVIAHIHLCLLSKQFKNKESLFQVNSVLYRNCYDY